MKSNFACSATPLAVCALLLCGCENRIPQDATSATANPATAPVAATVSPTPVTTAVPVNTATPIAVAPVALKPATVKAAAFKGEVGSLSGDVWVIPSNGKISAVDMWCPNGVTALELAARGTVAAGAWPKVKVRAINTKLSQSFDLADGFVIDSPTVKSYRITPPSPMPAGNYVVDVFFTNNSDGVTTDSKEDRNVYIQSVTLNPSDAAPSKAAEPAATPAALKAKEVVKVGKGLKGDGSIDGDAWKFASNGKAIAYDLYSGKLVKSLTVKARGTQAAGVWPNMQMRLVETKTGTLIVVFDPMTVDSAASKTFVKEFNPPLEAGNYNAEFLYNNNSEGIPADSKEDRNVWVESVSLMLVDE